MKQARILFFVDGPAPSADDFAEAEALSANVVFRNARAVSDDPQSLEICDGVAGQVPRLYAEKYPDAEEAISAFAAELAALSRSVGDEPAPTAKTTKAALKAAEKEEAKRQGIAPKVEVPKQAGGAPTWNPQVQTKA